MVGLQDATIGSPITAINMQHSHHLRYILIIWLYMLYRVIWYFFNLEETVMIKCQREPPKFSWPARIPSGQVS